MARILDLTGETFGKLNVLCRTCTPQDQIGIRKGSWWLCECSCGRREVLNGADLRENRRKQCRVCKANANSMAGEEHGTWRVLREATWDEAPQTKSSHKQSWWKVRCMHCGAEAIRNRQQLRNGYLQCTCVGVPHPPKPFVISAKEDNKVTTPIPVRHRKCKQCGKVFELESLGGGWGWTIGDNYFCTYKCMRAYERAPKGKKYKSRGLDE